MEYTMTLTFRWRNTKKFPREFQVKGLFENIDEAVTEAVRIARWHLEATGPSLKDTFGSEDLGMDICVEGDGDHTTISMVPCLEKLAQKVKDLLCRCELWEGPSWYIEGPDNHVSNSWTSQGVQEMIMKMLECGGYSTQKWVEFYTKMKKIEEAAMQAKSTADRAVQYIEEGKFGLARAALHTAAWLEAQYREAPVWATVMRRVDELVQQMEYEAIYPAKSCIAS